MPPSARSRSATPSGRKVPLALGPDVRNLDQVKAGDRGRRPVCRGAVAEADEAGQGDSRPRRSRPKRRAAARRASPAASSPSEVSVTADVIAVNPRRKMVTLRGPNRQVDLRRQRPRAAEADQGRRPDQRRLHPGARRVGGTEEEVAVGRRDDPPVCSGLVHRLARRARCLAAPRFFADWTEDSAPCTWQLAWAG